MDPKQEQEILAQAREFLVQIALELEASAVGARAAAAALPDRDASWPHAQQLFSRLQAATHLADQFQRTINEAVASGNQGARGADQRTQKPARPQPS